MRSIDLSQTVTGRHGVVRRSGAGNDNCVEVSLAGRTVLVRDSKDPTGPVLAVSLDAWAVFLEAVQSGQFDYS